MPTIRYSLNHYPVETLLTWMKSGEIAIPEIQRPFVWTPAKVCGFIDSLYHRLPGRVSHHLAEVRNSLEGGTYVNP